MDVSTILYFLKQTVGTPVPRGRGRRLEGFLPEQSSTASVAVQKVDIPVPSGGLQGFWRRTGFSSVFLMFSLSSCA